MRPITQVLVFLKSTILKEIYIKIRTPPLLGNQLACLVVFNKCKENHSIVRLKVGTIATLRKDQILIIRDCFSQDFHR